jgi:hypothetical protein
MNEYEKVLRAYMEERNVPSVAQLHRCVSRHDPGVTYKQVLGNLQGAWTHRGRDRRVNRAIAGALGLSNAEKMVLARANLCL